MSITVTKEFRKAFKKCMDYYGVTGEELESEKQRVRENYEQAEKCYLDIARGLSENQDIRSGICEDRTGTTSLRI